MTFMGLKCHYQKDQVVIYANQPNGFDTSNTSCFLEIHMSGDDEIFLMFLRGTLCNEVVKLKIELDHLKFESSENGAEIISFGQKVTFIKFFSFLGQHLVK